MFRRAYDHLNKETQYKSQISFVDENGEPCIGRCKQAHKDECDINRILANYDKTGLITHINTAAAEYGDFTEVNEYQVNLNMVIKAQQNFDELPAKIRKKFGNDPGIFFEFVTNPDNKDELIDLGLANAPVVDEPMRVILEESNISSEADSGTA